jgi:hypothetical protein
VIESLPEPAKCTLDGVTSLARGIGRAGGDAAGVPLAWLGAEYSTPPQGPQAMLPVESPTQAAVRLPQGRQGAVTCLARQHSKDSGYPYPFDCLDGIPYETLLPFVGRPRRRR